MNAQAEAARRQPLYALIKQEVAAQVAAGRLVVGDPLPTRSELAEKYSTTRATVDRALQELIREGLLSAGSGRRTRVASPSAKVATAIAVVWDWPEEETRESEDFLGALFAGIRRACTEYEIEVHYRREFASFSDVLRQTRAQGILMVRPGFGDVHRLERLRAAGRPVVTVPAVLSDGFVPAIASDNEQGVGLAVDHLVALGHRDIGLVSLTAAVPDHLERLRGFLAVAARHRLRLNPASLYVAETPFPHLYERQLREMLRRDKLPEALIVSDFGQCSVVLRRLAEIGANVPDDISVMCFDDAPEAAHLNPPLTVVRQDFGRLGYRAVETLMQCIAGRDAALVERVPTDLVVRASTAAPRRP